ETDGVGVVPVRLVRLAAEPGAEALHPAHRALAGDPRLAVRSARTFKTRAAGSGLLSHAWRWLVTTEQAVAFLVFAIVAAVSPGASNVMLTTAGANAGVWRGMPCLLGVTVGMGLMMFLVPLGLGSLVLSYPLVLRLLHWAGAAFLLWLAWKIATS